MGDIFISYASEDWLRAQTLAKCLQAEGWSVFWDRTIPSGKTWRQVIGKELTEARCVVVLWSQTSLESRWVHEEADDALRRGILIPAFIEKVQPPIGFRSIQAANLSEWDGAEAGQAFRRLVGDIASLIGPPADSVEEERNQAAAAAERLNEGRERAAAQPEKKAERGPPVSPINRPQPQAEDQPPRGDGRRASADEPHKQAPRRPASRPLLIVAVLILVFGIAGIAYWARPQQTVVAAADQSKPADALPNPDQRNVGDAQPARLYEEDQSRDGKHFSGSVVWTGRVNSGSSSEARELSARVQIPEAKMTVDLIIWSSAPKGLPPDDLAMDVSFTLASGFPHGGIQSVKGILTRDSEDKPAEFITGEFKTRNGGSFRFDALGDPSDRKRNVERLGRRWFGLLMIYTDGGRALLSFQKDDNAFAAAFKR